MSNIDLKPDQSTAPQTTQAGMPPPQIPGAVPVPPPMTKRKLRLPKISFGNKRKLVTILGISFGVLVLLLILAAFISNRSRNNNQEIIPTPTSEETTDIDNGGLEEAEMSEYAKDPDVIEIGKELDELEKKFDEVKIREEALSVPLLDFEVSFK